jgi:chemotaxis signal transduction protein
MTVVDLARALKLNSEGSSRRAVTMEIAGHHYAFVVSSVEQVEASVGPLCTVDNSIGRNWLPVVSGRIATESGTALLLDLRRLVAVGIELSDVGSN